MKLKLKQEVNKLQSKKILQTFFTFFVLLVLFICMDSSLFRDFLLMAYDLDMINGEYVFVYLDIFRLMRLIFFFLLL